MHVSVAKETDPENSIFSTQPASKANLTQRFRTGKMKAGLSHRKGAKMVQSIHLEPGKGRRNISGNKFSRRSRFKARVGGHRSVGGETVGHRFTGRLSGQKKSAFIQKTDTAHARSVFDSIQVGN